MIFAALLWLLAGAGCIVNAVRYSADQPGRALVWAVLAVAVVLLGKD